MRLAVLPTIVAVVAIGCGPTGASAPDAADGDGRGDAAGLPADETGETSDAASEAEAAGSVPSETEGPPGEERTTTTQPPRDVEHRFEANVSAVDETDRERFASTWNAGCPVALDRLAVVELSFWDYESRVRTGALVVHRDHVPAVLEVFERLFEARFPIERMDPVDVFGGDDDASMAANNTSAFNCREIAGAPGVWSQHAYGGAIDINPLVNPWVRGSRVDPVEGAAYVDRDQDVPGLIRAGDVVTEAFAAVGWGWGGDWDDAKDYQHFSWNGR